MSEMPFAALARPGLFTPDRRFCNMPVPPEQTVAVDPVMAARTEGYAAGFAAATASAEQALAEALAARGAIELAVIAANAQLEDLWRDRLESTVEALCNAALAPLAIDPAALAGRIARAAALLARADDDRVLRLHPDDLALVAQDLPDALAIMPDPALARGTVRFEGGQGGIEDGPELWRAALHEAIAQC